MRKYLLFCFILEKDAELEELSQKIEVLSAELTSAQSKLLHHISEAEQAKVALSEKEIQAAKQVEAIREELKSTNQLSLDTQEQVKKMEQKVRDSEMQINQRDLVIQDLKDDLKLARQTNEPSDTETELLALRLRYHALEATASEAAEVKTQLAQRTNELSTLKKKYDDIVNSDTAGKKTDFKEIQDLGERIQTLSQDLATKTKEAEEHRVSATTLSSENSSLKLEVEELKIKVEHLHKKSEEGENAKNLRTQIETLKAENGALQAERDERKADNDLLKAERDALKKERAAPNAELQNSEIAALRSEKDALTGQIAVLKAENSEMTRMDGDLRRFRGDLKKAQELAQKTAQEYSATIAALHEEKGRVESEKTRLQEENSVLQERFLLSDHSKRPTKEEFDELKATLKLEWQATAEALFRKKRWQNVLLVVAYLILAVGVATFFLSLHADRLPGEYHPS